MTLVDALAYVLAEVEAEKLTDTLFKVKVFALFDALADQPTGQGEEEAVVDALADTIAEERTETLIGRLLRVKFKGLINTLADTDAI